MEAIGLIVSALAAGAAASLKPAAEEAVKDAYAAIKNLIRARYTTVDVEAIERRPDSTVKQASVAEDLKSTRAGDDQELFERARALVELVARHDRAAADSVGVELDQVRAEFVKIGRVDAAGSGVKISKSEFTGGVEISAVTAGKGRDPSDPS
jgi:hypothetical protein